MGARGTDCPIMLAGLREPGWVSWVGQEAPEVYSWLTHPAELIVTCARCLWDLVRH